MLRACTMHACIVLCTCSTYNFIGRIRVHVFNCVILINIMTVMHENSETIKVGEMCWIMIYLSLLISPICRMWIPMGFFKGWGGGACWSLSLSTCNKEYWYIYAQVFYFSLSKLENVHYTLGNPECQVHKVVIFRAPFCWSDGEFDSLTFTGKRTVHAYTVPVQCELTSV